MRKIIHKIFSFFFKSEEDESLKVVSSYRDNYKHLDLLLSKLPELLSIVHADLSVLSQSKSKEREAEFSTENIFRALLVMQIEGLSFRETTIRIAESETL
ncbi:MAG: hypothetical protein LBU34_01785, partial [Planctomycetaceae bacterium]|nr:hypothetical protein [Planctomycetaceae bacterium]